MVPTTALAIPTYLLFARAELTDTYWAIILPSLVSPFGVFLMRVYAADAVDTTLIEAARVDGVGELRIFFTVALRLLMPGTVTVLLFALVSTWNNYFLPLLMLNSAGDVPAHRWGWPSGRPPPPAGPGAQALFSTVITGSLVSIIPLVVAFLFLQRYWQSGLSPAASKPDPTRFRRRTSKGGLLWSRLATRCCSAPPTTTSTSPPPGWTSTST